MSQVKLDRNKKIFDLYSDTSKRMSVPALARMFLVSEPRIRFILRQEKSRREREAHE